MGIGTVYVWGLVSVNIRNMNKRLILQRNQPIQDEGGGYTDTWVTIDEMYADRKPAGAREMTFAEQNSFQVSHIVIIRMREDIERGMRFLEGEREFDIQFYHAHDNRERFLKIYCKEGPVKDGRPL